MAYLAPHGGDPNAANARCRTSAKPAERHRGRFANARLPRPPGFNERRVGDKPWFIRKLDRLTPAQIAALRTDYQSRRESLQAVDEGVASMVEALRRRGDAPQPALPRRSAQAGA